LESLFGHQIDSIPTSSERRFQGARTSQTQWAARIPQGCRHSLSESCRLAPPEPKIPISSNAEFRAQLLLCLSDHLNYFVDGIHGISYKISVIRRQLIMKVLAKSRKLGLRSMFRCKDFLQVSDKGRQVFQNSVPHDVSKFFLTLPLAKETALSAASRMWRRQAMSSRCILHQGFRQDPLSEISAQISGVLISTFLPSSMADSSSSMSKSRKKLGVFPASNPQAHRCRSQSKSSRKAEPNSESLLI